MPCSIWGARARGAQPIEQIRGIPAMTRATIESADSNPIPVPASGAETHGKTFRGFLRYGCFSQKYNAVMKPPRVASLFFALLCTLLTGCATYEYDLVRPEQFATHIGRQQDVKFSL